MNQDKPLFSKAELAALAASGPQRICCACISFVCGVEPASADGKCPVCGDQQGANDPLTAEAKTEQPAAGPNPAEVVVAGPRNGTTMNVLDAISELLCLADDCWPDALLPANARVVLLLRACGLGRDEVVPWLVANARYKWDHTITTQQVSDYLNAEADLLEKSKARARNDVRIAAARALDTEARS